jgi:hypothetical protein
MLILPERGPLRCVITLCKDEPETNLYTVSAIASSCLVPIRLRRLLGTSGTLREYLIDLGVQDKIVR